jgi:hypothetical protein
MPFGLPDMTKIEAALDEDFAGLTARLDTMIDLQRQILAALTKQNTGETSG